jgi:hypothetical protein
MFRLLDSILASGDGRSPETAFHVFQVKEEYVVLKYFRLNMVQQELLEQGVQHFDLMHCEDTDGNSYRPQQPL